ncbi:dephospho-CoA kinase [Psychroserpens sp. XS_ASV72]|uniref:dephospho-CoA kinase n=1 Tax=Psychroserpens sp. XS_ASV72 TaxID=3241293 RepID=UPI0035115831
MIIVGLTGGIGSGKTTVSQLFKGYGVPVYIADKEAKLLMNHSEELKQKLIVLFGTEAYKNQELNRAYIASKIFKDKHLLDQMNAIVHPEVGAHFKGWLKTQETPYVIKEAAIIFEQNMQSEYDLIITVIADEDERIKRVVNRDKSNSEKVKAIIKNQLSDSEKAKQSDFVIVNNHLETLENQVAKIHKSILEFISGSPN